MQQDGKGVWIEIYSIAVEILRDRGLHKTITAEMIELYKACFLVFQKQFEKANSILKRHEKESDVNDMSDVAILRMKIVAFMSLC